MELHGEVPRGIAERGGLPIDDGDRAPELLVDQNVVVPEIAVSQRRPELQHLRIGEEPIPPRANRAVLVRRDLVTQGRKDVVAERFEAASVPVALGQPERLGLLDGEPMKRE
jgi:hypothetical protein